jgi:hypothetical protein
MQKNMYLFLDFVNCVFRSLIKIYKSLSKKLSHRIRNNAFKLIACTKKHQIINNACLSNTTFFSDLHSPTNKIPNQQQSCIIQMYPQVEMNTFGFEIEL